MMKRMPAKRAPITSPLGMTTMRAKPQCAMTAIFDNRRMMGWRRMAGYTGAYRTGAAGRVQAQIREITQPTNVQPKKRLTRKIADVFG